MEQPPGVASQGHSQRIKEPYASTTLDSAIKEIRLLTIDETQSSPQLICCAMTTVPLLAAPPFLALSYTWGPSTDCEHTIEINKVHFKVRHNLWLFLQRMLAHLRALENEETTSCECDGTQQSPSPAATCFLGHVVKPSQRIVTYMWIDAICINQEDSVEKNFQVPLMGSLYAQAQHVLVWLGNPEGSRNPGMIFDSIKSEILSGSREYDLDYDDKAGSLGDSRLRNLLEILACNYWTRRWVIQELIQARVAVLLHGDKWLAMEHLAEHGYFNPEMWGLPEDVEALPIQKRAHRIIGSALQIQENRDEDKRRLETLIEGCPFTECTIRKDYFYALFGLIADTSAFRKHPIAVDYTKSDEDTIQSVLRHMVLVRRDESPLRLQYYRTMKAMRTIAADLQVSWDMMLRLVQAEFPDDRDLLRKLDWSRGTGSFAYGQAMGELEMERLNALRSEQRKT